MFSKVQETKEKIANSQPVLATVQSVNKFNERVPYNPGAVLLVAGTTGIVAGVFVMFGSVLLGLIFIFVGIYAFRKSGIKIF